MADNVTAPGVGAILAADDISGTYYPRSKIVIGADGVNDGDVSAANPLPVTVTALPAGLATAANQSTEITSLSSIDTKLSSQATAANQATLQTAVDAINTKTPALASGSVPSVLTAGSAQIGSVVGRTAVVTVAPTVTASAYTAGNVVGGKMTFASMLDAALSGMLESIHVVSKTALTAGLKLYLFNADPSSSTFTDKSAPSIHASDFAKLIGVYPLSQPDSGLGTHAVWLLDSIGKSFNAGSSSLYAVLVTTGTPTPGSTSDFSVTLAVIKD